MKAIVLNKTGKPGVLALKEVETPKPGENDVLVKLQYSGVNYAEILSRKGLYGWAVKRPYILGMEGSGIIEAVGKNVPMTRIGETVMVGTQYGCYAEKVVAPQEQALPILPTLDIIKSAAFLVNYMTAWVSLFTLAKLAPGEKVLITAAAGGVGTAAVQLALKSGCKVFALAGNTEKISFLESLGVTAAISYYHKNWFEELSDRSGGVDVALEMVGGEIFKKSYECLMPFGRLVVAGFASLDLKKWNPASWWKTWHDLPRVSVMKLAEKSVAIMASHLGYLLKNPSKMHEIFEELREFVNTHQIKPHVQKIFPIENVVEAHRFIESRKNIGKILLKI